MSFHTPLTGKSGKKGSKDFLIKIMFRKNVNWQGEIHWLETNQKRRFRSSLELVMLIQQALDESRSPHADYEFRSWKHNGVEIIDCQG